MYKYYDNWNIKEEIHLNLRWNTCWKYISYYENWQIKEETNQDKYWYYYWEYTSYYENWQIKIKKVYWRYWENTSYYKNWQIEAHWFANKRCRPVGEWTYYYENGQIKSKWVYILAHRWINKIPCYGEKDWERIYYTEDWDIEKIENYEKGELIKSEEF